MTQAPQKLGLIKRLPNALSCARIVLSFVLLFVEPLSAAFFVVYLACGTTDVLDGVLARRLRATTKAGAVLDSVGDVAFIGALFIVMVPLLALPVALWLWVGVVAAVRLASLVVGAVRYRAWATLHTRANKVTGLALFCFPLLFALFGTVPSTVFFCAVATLSAVEELLINLRSDSLDRNVRGML